MDDGVVSTNGTSGAAWPRRCRQEKGAAPGDTITAPTWSAQNVDQWQQDHSPAWSVPLAFCSKTPPCVRSKRPRVYRHHARMCYHMRAWCRYTRGRFESTHGGFLHGHTEERGRGERGEGGHRQFCLPRKAHEECSLGSISSPKETLGSYPFEV